MRITIFGEGFSGSISKVSYKIGGYQLPKSSSLHNSDSSTEIVLNFDSGYIIAPMEFYMFLAQF